MTNFIMSFFDEFCEQAKPKSCLQKLTMEMVKRDGKPPKLRTK